jgi:predicted regulator of Ras-like GTPase activity (Roadblock/LC7/MglB family)
VLQSPQAKFFSDRPHQLKDKPMPLSPTNAELTSSTLLASPALSYLDDIIGAAIFDVNGLPKEYFTTHESTNMSWVQTIFQALGLRSLLMSSLQLENFHHATIEGQEYLAVIVKQRTQYTALLLRPREDECSDQLLKWIQNFQTDTLKQHSRFRAT